MKRKDQKQLTKKISRQVKDFVPPLMLKNLHPMEHVTSQANNAQGKEYVEMFAPSHILPEWTFQNIEEVNFEIYKDEKDDLFEDPDHKYLSKNLPLSFIKITENQIKWDRPTTYVTNYYLDREIQQTYRRKNYTSMREDIKKSFINRTQNESEDDDDEQNNFNSNLKHDTESAKQAIYKDFYKYLEMSYEYKVVNCITRTETDEEYLQRKQDEEKERQKSKSKAPRYSKNIKLNLQFKGEINDKIQISIPQPSRFSLINFKLGHLTYHHWFTWYTSIYQMILDQNINDSLTNKSIINNIYPQKDGIPIYNPKGKYIIKLYCMGKPRKVVIDDRIPCNREHEFIFPRCSDIEEIWPALFSKALLKLGMYKARHPAYYLNEEFMDPNLIYSLTGHHTIILDVIPSILSLFQNYFKFDSKHEDEDRAYFAMFKSFKNHSMEDKKSYEDKVAEYKLKTNKIKQKYLISFDLSENPNLNTKKGLAKSDIAHEKVAPKRKGRNSVFAKQTSEKALCNPSKFERTKKKFPTIIQSQKIEGVVVTQSKEENLITDNKIIVNFCYSVTDFFKNDNFNMKRLKYLDFSDLQKELQEKNFQFKQLPINEKKIYLQNRRELKKKQFEEKNKRLIEIQQIGKSYTLIKIICQTLFIPVYEGSNEFSEIEIMWAKKCILNKWAYPPVSYFSSYFDDIKRQQALDKVLTPLISKNEPNSTEVETGQPPKSYSSFLLSEEAYIQLIGGNVDKYQTCLEPRKTNVSGYWLTNTELLEAFDKIVIIQNQNKLFHHKIYSDNSWNYYKTDVFEPLEDYHAFILKKNTTENNSEKYAILIVFEPYTEFLPNNEKKNVVSPYINLEFIDLTNMKVIKENLILNKFYSVFSFDEMEGNCDYGLVIKGGTFPTGYILQIMSQVHTITNLSTNEYLKQIYHYQSVSFKIDHPYIDSNSFWIISRIIMTTSNPDNEDNSGGCSFKLSLKYPIKYIKQIVVIYLQCSTSQKKKEINYDEFITLNEEEMTEPYYITLSIKSEYKIKEGTFEIDILYNNNNARFEIIEHIEPYIIMDKYTPNKGRCLFSEYLYPSDKISCSLKIKLTSLIMDEHQKKNETKKGKPTNSSNEQGINLSSFSEGKDFKQKIRLVLELYHLTKEPSLDFIYDSIKNSYSNQGELVYSWDFYNEITITQLNLDGDFLQSFVEHNKKKVVANKKDLKDQAINQSQSQHQPNYPYLLICYFAQNEVSEKIISNSSGDIGWFIKVFSSDLIGFVKDTSKDEHESKLKEGWEECEGGRSMKASRSRQRYLCVDKKKKGANLNKEEEELLNEERERKNSPSPNDETLKTLKASTIDQKKNKVGPASKDKKFVVKKSGDRNSLEKQSSDSQNSFSMKNIFARPTPKLRDTKSEFVSKYVKYANKERTFVKQSQYYSSIVDKEYRDKIKLSILKNYEQSELNYKNNSMVNLTNRKNDLSQSLNGLSKSLSMIRLTKRENNSSLYNYRNNIQHDYQKKYDTEKKIKEILSETIQKNIDFNYITSVYKEGLNIFGEENQQIKQLFRYISQMKEDSLKNELKKLNGKDQTHIVKLLEDISYNKWEISEEIINKLKSFLK